MSSPLVKLLGGLLIVLCLQAAATADSIDLNAVGVGARPMGMGRAYTAIADDANAVFANPAGLGTQKNWGLTSMTTKLLDRVEYKMAAAVYPTQYGTIGVGYLSATTPAGYLTTDQASLATASSISYGSSVMILSYGRDLSEVIKNSSSLGKMSVGANVKLISDNYSGVDSSAAGTSVDLGMIVRPTANLSGGFTLQNVGGSVNWKSGTKENLPTTGKLGAALNLEKASAAADIEFGGGNTLAHGGIEVRPMDMLALRAGVDQSKVSATDTALNLTYGVGVKTDGFSFDYAYRQDTTFNENSAYYFSISFQPVFKKAAPEVAVKIDNPVQPTVSETNSDGVFRVVKKTADKAIDKDILKYYE